VLLPLTAAVIWGVFAVRGDPSRSGKTVVPTNGFIRLILELIFFGLAALALFNLNYNILSTVFCLLVVLHYGFSVNRIAWLLKH
jgi:hypothetical protein